MLTFTIFRFIFGFSGAGFVHFGLEIVENFLPGLAFAVVGGIIVLSSVFFIKPVQAETELSYEHLVQLKENA